MNPEVSNESDDRPTMTAAEWRALHRDFKVIDPELGRMRVVWDPKLGTILERVRVIPEPRRRPRRETERGRAER